MSSIGERLRKRKANEVDVFEYTGQEPVPKDVVSVRFHPSIVEMGDNDEPNLSNDLLFSKCRQLKEVVFNEGLEKIGVLSFWGCHSLESISLPSTLIELRDHAFQNCRNLRKVVLNEGLRKIGEGAFHQCVSLESINIPSTVTVIGSRVFIDCKLQSIAIPSSVNEICCHTFSSCDSLTEAVINEGPTSIESWAFSNCKALQSITIPSTVTEIGKCAFQYCNNLREVVLNDGIKKIKGQSFHECTSLESITIPSTMSEIWDNAFDSCTNLREVILHNKSVRNTEEDWVFNDNHEGIQISVNAFQDCTLLERFKFPDLFTRLDNIIQAGQRGIEAKLDDIPALEWRGGELALPAVQQEEEELITEGIIILVDFDTEKLAKVEALIRHFEIKEATTLFELALWKARGLIKQMLMMLTVMTIVLKYQGR